MSITVRQWGSLSILVGTIMVLSGVLSGFPTLTTLLDGSGNAQQSSGSSGHSVTPSLTSGSLPEFPSNLTHFIYVVRENHVFDDYLGDCSIDINSTCNGGTAYNSPTSGSPSVETSPSGDQTLTPNLHTLARDYAVFDNMYSSIDPFSSQAHAYLFASNVWGGADSCAGTVEGTGTGTEWGVYNDSNVKGGSCSWSPNSGSQSYNTNGGSVFDRFLGTNVPQTKTTIPFLTVGDIVWELSSPGCKTSSSTSIPGDGQNAVEHVTGCTNGWWKNSTSGAADMPSTVNTATGIPQMLWECQYAASCGGGAPTPFTDQIPANSFTAFVADYGLPTYTFIELFDDHPGGNCGQTQATCISLNDAAMNTIVGDVENSSAYSGSTAIAISEDDTQNGANGQDHVNDGRRLPFVLVAPHTVENSGGTASSCGLSSTYTSCGYVVHQTFNTSNVLAVMERVEMNVNPSIFVTGGPSSSSDAFPMVQNDYLAEGDPLEPLWMCSGSHAAYCNTGVSTTQTLASTAISPNPISLAAGTSTSLTASAKDTTGNPITSGVTYSWSIAPSTLGTLSPLSGSPVALAAGSSSGTGSVCENATYNGVTSQACAGVTVSASVSLASVAVAPPGPVSVTTGGSQSFVASSLATNGQSLTSVTSFSWTLSSSTLGSLNATAGSSVRFSAGASTGNISVCVTGTYNSVSKGPSCASVSITKAAPTLNSVTESPSSVVLGEGATQSFTAQAFDQYGNPMSSGISYSWSESSASLGSLSSTTGQSVTFTAGTTPGASGTISVMATYGPATPASATSSVSVFGVAITESATSGTAPLSISFTANAAGGTGPYAYSWVFGDGTNSTVQNTSHTYSTAGTFTATLTAKDSAGRSAGTSVVITVSAPTSGGCTSPTAVTIGTQVSGTVPAGGCMLFSTVLTQSQWNYWYYLDVYETDGQVSGSQPVFTAYAGMPPPSITASNAAQSKAGPNAAISISLTTQNANQYGGWGTYDFLIQASSSGSGSFCFLAKLSNSQAGTSPSCNAGGSPLTASVSASPTSGVAPLSVTFTGSASGGISPYTYSWAFGDGATSSYSSPSHTYSSAGTFTATLTVKDSTGASASKSTTITVSASGGGGCTSPTPITFGTQVWASLGAGGCMLYSVTLTQAKWNDYYYLNLYETDGQVSGNQPVFTLYAGISPPTLTGANAAASQAGPNAALEVDLLTQAQGQYGGWGTYEFLIQSSSGGSGSFCFVVHLSNYPVGRSPACTAMASSPGNAVVDMGNAPATLSITPFWTVWILVGCIFIIVPVIVQRRVLLPDERGRNV